MQRVMDQVSQSCDIMNSQSAQKDRGSESESAKYSKHLINRVLHGAPIIEVIFFLREEKPVLALLMLSAKQGSHWYHF